MPNPKMTIFDHHAPIFCKLSFTTFMMVITVLLAMQPGIGQIILMSPHSLVHHYSAEIY
jgi:hypothetical protein